MVVHLSLPFTHLDTISHEPRQRRVLNPNQPKMDAQSLAELVKQAEKLGLQAKADSAHSMAAERADEEFLDRL